MPIQIRSFSVSLKIARLAGGAPSNLEAYRLFLQNPMMARNVPPGARREFEEQVLETGVPNTQGAAIDTVVRTGFNMTEDGQPFLWNYQIKAMLHGAATSLYDRYSKPSIYQISPAITHTLEVTPERIVITEGTIREKPWIISQVISHPRNPDIKIPSNRERQILDNGLIKFECHLLEAGRAKELLKVLEDLFLAGGHFVGLGTDRGYNHGRFELTGFQELESQEIGGPPGGISSLDPRFDNPARKGIGYQRKRKPPSRTAPEA